MVHIKLLNVPVKPLISSNCWRVPVFTLFFIAPCLNLFIILQMIPIRHCPYRQSFSTINPSLLLWSFWVPIKTLFVLILSYRFWSNGKVYHLTTQHGGLGSTEDHLPPWGQGALGSRRDDRKNEGQPPLRKKSIRKMTTPWILEGLHLTVSIRVELAPCLP